MSGDGDSGLVDSFDVTVDRIELFDVIIGDRRSGFLGDPSSEMRWLCEVRLHCL